MKKTQKSVLVVLVLLLIFSIEKCYYTNKRLEQNEKELRKERINQLPKQNKHRFE